MARTLKYVSAIIALMLSASITWAQDGVEISDIDQDGVADVAANVPTESQPILALWWSRVGPQDERDPDTMIPNGRVLPDHDGDGLGEIGITSNQGGRNRLLVWLSSRGSPVGRQPDIVVNELFAGQTAAFTQIGAAPDIDGDGVREITTLGTVVDPVNQMSVPVLSFYATKHGQASLSLFGRDARVLQRVIEGRALGQPVDYLMMSIASSDGVRADFALARVAGDSVGTAGPPDSSSSSNPTPGLQDLIDKGMQIPRITWVLREWDSSK